MVRVNPNPSSFTPVSYEQRIAELTDLDWRGLIPVADPIVVRDGVWPPCQICGATITETETNVAGKDEAHDYGLMAWVPVTRYLTFGPCLHTVKFDVEPRLMASKTGMIVHEWPSDRG